jgi:hypothetical protein
MDEHTVENDAGHLWRAVGPNAGDLWNQCANCGADEGSIRGRTPCPPWVTIDVGYVHTLTDDGACRPDCPHPGHRPIPPAKTGDGDS